MQGGFSFCDTDIAELALEYVPDNTNTYVYAHAPYKNHEQSFDGHDGGYYFGATTEAKSFVLRCIYQEQHINSGILARIESFFHKGRTGRLVFKQRPWLYYIATVTSIEISSITNYLNGFVTIRLKAYYPYGRYDSPFYPVGDEHAANIEANSNMLSNVYAQPTDIIPSGQTLTQTTDVLLYNGGTVNSPVAVRIAGDVGDGVVIENKTTGQSMKIIRQTKDITTNIGKYLICDALTGRTVLANDNVAEDAGIYHDFGYLTLTPNVVSGLDVERMSIGDGSNVVVTGDNKPFPQTAIGQYIFVDNSWHRIENWYTPGDRSSIVVDKDAYLSMSTGIMPVASMNHIVIKPVSTMDLTKLDFVYKPMFT